MLRWKFTQRGVLLLVDSNRRVHAAVTKGTDGYQFSLSDEDGKAWYRSDPSYADSSIAAEAAMDALGL
jgi:hypothetical protein